MRSPSITSQLFVENRKRLIEMFDESMLGVIRSNDLMPKNADTFYPFEQNSNLVYLTGVDQEQTSLILFPGAQSDLMREILFIRESNEQTVVWEGEKLSKQEAREISGVSTIYFEREFDAVFQKLAIEAEVLALELNEHTRMASPVMMGNERFGLQVREQYPLHRYQRLSPLLTELRMVKQGAEVEAMTKALKVTEDGFRRVLRFVKPDVGEWQVEAEYIHEFVRQGSKGFAYEPIVASGKNACILHYLDNKEFCREGDLLLMDVAAEWNGWNADMTRTIPVNGVFSERQRAVYDAVLSVLRTAEELLKPGVSLKDYQFEVIWAMEQELVQLNLISVLEGATEDERVRAVKQYFMHGTSHHLGLDVHDVCDAAGRVREGMVFTIEPGIYIPEEKIGVRLENNYYVGAHKNENLSIGIPIEPDEIESLMAH